MKRLIVDKNISKYTISFLESLDYSLIFSIELCDVKNSTSTHPDMQFVKIGDKKAIVASQSLNYYKSQLTDFEFVAVENIKSPYPDDTTLNFALVGNNVVCTKYQYNRIKELQNYDCIFVKQGYTKCSICVLNDSTIITGDRGIAKSLENSNIKAYYLPCDQIKLDGYDNGFWGGASGLIEKNKLFFNGNIKNLSCYDELVSILEQEKIEPVYQTNSEVYDNGSIILID